MLHGSILVQSPATFNLKKHQSSHSFTLDSKEQSQRLVITFNPYNATAIAHPIDTSLPQKALNMMDVREPSVFQNDPPSSTQPRPQDVTSASAAQGKEALKDIAFGSLAGVAGKYVEYPFDTVKVRLQSQPDGVPLKYTGPLDCFGQSLRKDGFFGLYRGISAPLFGAALETSSLFFSVGIFIPPRDKTDKPTVSNRTRYHAINNPQQQ